MGFEPGPHLPGRSGLAFEKRPPQGMARELPQLMDTEEVGGPWGMSN